MALVLELLSVPMTTHIRWTLVDTDNTDTDDETSDCRYLTPSSSFSIVLFAAFKHLQALLAFLEGHSLP